MVSTSAKGIVNAPAEKVWQTLRPFVGYERFVPPMASTSVEGSGIGARRTVVLQDGTQLTEILELLDDSTRTLRYRVVDPCPLPFEQYTSILAVRDLGSDQSEFEWSGTFTPKGAPEVDVIQAMQQLYSSGVEGMRRLYSA